MCLGTCAFPAPAPWIQHLSLHRLNVRTPCRKEDTVDKAGLRNILLGYLFLCLSIDTVQSAFIPVAMRAGSALLSFADGLNLFSCVPLRVPALAQLASDVAETCMYPLEVL